MSIRRSEVFFPSSARRGGCAISKKLRSVLSRADGVVIRWNWITTPSAPQRGLRDIFDVAATPPRRGGENVGCNSSAGWRVAECLTDAFKNYLDVIVNGLILEPDHGESEPF